MNNFFEYVCRGVIRSEDAIRDLSKNVASLTKCNRHLAGSVVCIGVAGLLMTWVIYDQDKEIKALKKQTAELAKEVEAHADPVVVNVANDMEEQNEQEGA